MLRISAFMIRIIRKKKKIDQEGNEEKQDKSKGRKGKKQDGKKGRKAG